MIVIKLQMKSGFGVLAQTYTKVQQTFQVNIILRQTNILENSTMQLNGS